MKIKISFEKDNKKTAYSFSKKILCVGLLILLVITGFSFYTVITTGSIEVLVALIGVFGVCLTAAVAFYFWKERSNNNYKYAEDFIERMADKYGIENISEILQALIAGNSNIE